MIIPDEYLMVHTVQACIIACVEDEPMIRKAMVDYVELVRETQEAGIAGDIIEFDSAHGDKVILRADTIWCVIRHSHASLRATAQWNIDHEQLFTTASKAGL